MAEQLTSSILMVSPDSFAYNRQTAESNTFQSELNYDTETLRKKVMNEFKAMVNTLNENGVDVFISGNDTGEDLPDAVFPNNWFATYEDGTVVLFPMLTPNRRKERDRNIIENIFEPAGFQAKTLLDLSAYENKKMFLEGTGSLVLDRKNNAVFAIESERTTRHMFDIYCSRMNIQESNRIFFRAEDENGAPIYHTNVIMSIGEGFAVICAECIHDKNEKASVLDKLSQLGLDVITINYSQLKAFCGNLLNVKSKNGESLIIMSENAKSSFNDEQLSRLSKYGKIVSVNIDTIEKVGGGSARCMMAEIFLPISG
jgi:hypothetical protein